MTWQPAFSSPLAVLTAGCVKAPASHATGCHLVGPAPGTPVCVLTLTQHTLIKWPAHSCLLKGSWHGWEHRARLVTYPESGTLGPVQQTPIKAPSAGCRPLPVRCVAAAMLGHPHVLLIVLLSGGVAVVLLHSTCVCWSVVWVGGGVYSRAIWGWYASQWIAGRHTAGCCV